MKSKTLSASLIWDGIKKQMWIVVLIFLALVFAYPVREFMQFDVWMSWKSLKPTQIMTEYLCYIHSTMIIYGMPILVVSGLVNGIFGFSWLHSHQKVDFYHSLPIRREALFMNQSMVGVLFYVVPLVISSILCLCVGAGQGYFSMEIVGAMASTVGLLILVYLLVYGFAILAMMLTGRILVGALGAVAFLTYIPVVTALIGDYADVFFTTYVPDYSTFSVGFPKNFYYYGSPVLWLLKYTDHMKPGGKLGIPPLELLLAGILCVALYLLCLWLYKIRPSEGTEKSMLYYPFGRAVKFLVEIPAALTCGLIVFNMAPMSARLFWWIAGLMFGLILAHSIMEVIYQMDFRKFLDHKLELGIEAVLLAGLVSVFVFDITGFDTYLPKQDDLAYVSLSPSDLLKDDRISIISDESDQMMASVDYSEGLLMNHMKLQPDEKLYSILQQMVENQIDFQWKEERDENRNQRKYLRVAYQLKNGKRIRRAYLYEETEELRDQVSALWNREDFRQGLYGDLEEKTSYLNEVRWESYEEYGLLYTKNEEERFKIIDAILADVQEADESTYLEDPVGKLCLEYHPDNGDWTALEEVTVYPGFSRTMDILKEKEMPVVTDLAEEELISVVVTDFRETERGEKMAEDIGAKTEESETYTDPEVMKRLVSHLNTYTSYAGFQHPRNEPSISVEVTRKDSKGNPITTYHSFREGELPEELKK